MDDFLSDLESLKALAARARPACPPDAGRVLAAIRSLEPRPFVFPGADGECRRLFISLGGMAAAAALCVAILGASAWSEIDDPLSGLAYLPSLASLMDS